MREGIYESLVTRGLAEELTTLSQLEKVISDVDEGDHAHVLARHVELTLRRTLASHIAEHPRFGAPPGDRERTTNRSR